MLYNAATACPGHVSYGQQELVERANREAHFADHMLPQMASIGSHACRPHRQWIWMRCTDKRVSLVQHEGQLEQGAAGEAANGAQGDAAHRACVQCPAGSL